MPRSLPPAECLRAFDAFARTHSVRAAAEDLGVSSATVSRHLAQLEAWTGRPLLEPSGRRLLLTEHGEVLARRLLLHYRQLESDCEDVCGEKPARRAVTVLVSGALALSWLTSRILRLGLLEPRIEILLTNGVSTPYWYNLPFDIAITRTGQAPSSVRVEEIGADVVTLACAASRMRDLVYSRAACPGRMWFALQPAAVSFVNAEDTRRWAEAARISSEDLRRIEHPTMIACLGDINAARACVIASRLYLDQALEDGRFLEPWPGLRTPASSWYLCRRTDRPASEAVETVCAFLREEMLQALSRPMRRRTDLPFGRS